MQVYIFTIGLKELIQFLIGTMPTPDPPIDGTCPDSRWQDLGGSNCYLFHKSEKVSWGQASQM